MCSAAFSQSKLVALSFDDGPNTSTTVQMLDVLKKHNVKASFFVIGKNINEESAKIMYDNIDLTFICGEGSNDWEDNVSADQRVEKILASAKDGLIYLLHDFEGNSKTVEAVDRIIPILKERGYTFVTVRELMKQKKLKPERGVIYTHIQ